MAVSDAILTRLLSLHPKIIDLSLDRIERILARLGHPERHLPPVIHVAGTNGKGSTVAFCRAMIEAAGLTAHVYTSPHLVRFHERIRVAGELIGEEALSHLLEECEAANGGEPITFFEITTAAAFLAFARSKADYLLLEVGLGGRLDATNMVARPAVTCITSIGLDHQQYLGETIALIAREKAGILKRGVTSIVGRMPEEARNAIEDVAGDVKAPLQISGQDWDCYAQHGRLVFQDQDGLLDLPLPALRGQHQIDNAGNAIAIMRALADERIGEAQIAAGLRAATWPARLQLLRNGGLSRLLPQEAELWLDGGHNADAGIIIADALRRMNEKAAKPLIIIWGMLNTKDATQFFRPLAQLAGHVITLTIPNETNAIPAEALADTVRALGTPASTATGVENAVRQAADLAPAPRVLICGSLYLAGHVLAAEENQEMSAVSGVARR
ncbi:MAG: bifunctional folylpolyglutamate synthase/dihydrofolate synthase [Proteobacteria bacterium]|nr:bifunctional folylpolyglutamate synthase/dihydrofolate synthase [Pseudomonadota bacterium]